MVRIPDDKPTASPLTLAILALVILTAVGLRISDAWSARRPVIATATLRGKTFTIEVAESDVKKEKGLGDRDNLAVDHGMFFPFGAERYWVFWMKDMRFPIDIIWMRGGKVVDIDASVPVSKSEPLETYSPIEPADSVLELNAGVAAEIGLQKGDEVILKAVDR